MGDFKVIVRNSGPYRLEGEGITICDQEGRVYGLAGRTVVRSEERRVGKECRL